MAQTNYIKHRLLNYVKEYGPITGVDALKSMYSEIGDENLARVAIWKLMEQNLIELTTTRELKYKLS
ncbi:hypothetical protein LCGC14_2691360 [marine sediment metagenome]|uniref:Uncharacterized protein n=1 Tax=marine sediment metagenome TaxID=412755 RepID=A0A0F8ZIH3_9ZZZZ